MTDDIVKFEVDGKPVEGRTGQMIMEVTDSIGAYIPRFCYHEKLTVAANCRMCLVEVEKAPKPLPACATPIGDGMKVFTRSPKAISAQKATMEFLLINHPLDCPICDQGGECELQDLAMGFGRDVSRYTERKRVVKDMDLGPLVSTDMTRCIHCTRCVRFGEEIAGIPELGTIGRTEDMKISTYIEKSIDHELSGNIIDLCPVGALNNKPYRYSARAWEMEQHPTVSPHDCVGSNMFAHVLRGTVKRIVPRQNEAINETWLADRDRYSYEGIYSSDRLRSPRVKEAGKWHDISWEDALEKAAQMLADSSADKLGILASAGATTEEAYLLARIADHLETANIDHRLRRRDFSDQGEDALFPWLGCHIADIENCDAVLIAGSNIRREAPILAHRLRKAALGGAKLAFVNGEVFDHHFDVAEYVAGRGLVEQLSGIAVAAAGRKKLPPAVSGLCKGVKPDDQQQHVARLLSDAKQGLVLLGNIGGRHKAFTAVRALAASIAASTAARLGFLSEGANSAGACLAGVLPHRRAGGAAREQQGLHAGEMLDADLDAVLLFGLEPDIDVTATEDAVGKLAAQKFVIAFSPYTSASLDEAAHLHLPIGTFAETAGTFVNCEGRWQSFAGIAKPVGQARPGWKVLRVLGNLLGAEGFDYVSAAEVREELEAQLGEVHPDNAYRRKKALKRPNGEDAPEHDIDVPIYAVDAVVRRATALQLTPEAERSRGAAA
ncbi:MAG: NADH-quinone oxidoreductase subunit NuoG [Woeseiaceae bacterium]